MNFDMNFSFFTQDGIMTAFTCGKIYLYHLMGELIEEKKYTFATS